MTRCERHGLGFLVEFKCFPDERTILIERDNYFQLSITIETLGLTPGIPVHLAQKLQNTNIETISFLVACEANFSRWTAESKTTAQNKEWVEWLFAELKQDLADPQ